MKKEEKGIFGDGFTESFIRNVKELQELDNWSVNRPLYVQNRDLIFNEMSRRFMGRLREKIGEPDVTGITLDKALSYYVNGEKGNPVLDYIASRARPLCELMHISPEVYAINAFCTAVLMTLGRNNEAYLMFAVMMRPLVAAFRRRDAAVQRGKKGGRPEHRHKREAIAVAENFLMATPRATLYRLVQVTAGELARKYPDAPSARSVETWLKQELQKA
ncbi:TPA: hypothetical protein ACYSCZ_002870 [Klebsiella oxytoca]